MTGTGQGNGGNGSKVVRASGGTGTTARARAEGRPAWEARKVWAEVADSLEALALGLKPHHEERSTGRTPADPIHGLAAKITGAVGPVGDAVKDPAVDLQTAKVAKAIEQALRETAQAIPATGRHAAQEPVRFLGDVVQAAEESDGHRRVLFTGVQSRLVVRSLAPGESIGAETHPADQVLLLLKGTGECAVEGDARAFTGNDALCVPAGARHDVRNTGTEPMRIATVYAPARHAAGAVHRTEAAAYAA